MILLLILGIVIALLAYFCKIIFDLPIFPTVAGFLFIFYIIYNWFDYLFFKKDKTIQYEDPIFPKLKTGLSPTSRDLNMDLSKKILETDFDLKDSNTNDSDL